MKTFKELNINSNINKLDLALDLDDLKLYSNNDNDVSTKSNDTFNDNSDIQTKVFIKKKLSSKSSFTVKKQNHQINIEDLILLFSKLKKLYSNINSNSINYISKHCYDIFNFYFNSSIKGNFESFFIDNISNNIVNIYSKLFLLSLMILYNISYLKKDYNTCSNYFKSIELYILKNYFIICSYILSKINDNFKTGNTWVELLSELLKLNKVVIINNSYMSQIKCNNQSIYSLIENIINTITIQDNILSLFNQIKSDIYSESNIINQISNEKLKDIFINEICVCDNINGPLISTIFLKDLNLYTCNFNESELRSKNIYPYIKEPCKKKFTLILDLDETLISFKESEYDDTEGSVRIRPGLIDFLSTLKNIYEIIIFTAAIKEYADPILNAIEKDNKYFDYRLYREHTSIVGIDFVKDISKLGRDLSKMIIVDNLPQNFKVQRENGILISSFYGEDQKDTALIHLKDILIKISNEFEDLREGLKKYKNDIIKLVSSNIYV